MIEALLRASFGGEPPDAVRELVEVGLAEALLEDFKVGPIFPLHGGPVRVAVSDQGEGEAWQRRVLARWGGSATERFLRQVPGARRMVDTDGEGAVLYLDDLQDTAAKPSAPVPGGGALMCLTLAVPGGARAVITRHEDPPLALLGGELAGRAAALVAAGAVGVWGLRWQGPRPSGLIWVSESRWRGNADESQAIAEGLGAHPGWAAACATLRARGLVPYPDAVELLEGGGVDVTLGVLRAR